MCDVIGGNVCCLCMLELVVCADVVSCWFVLLVVFVGVDCVSCSCCLWLVLSLCVVVVVWCCVLLLVLFVFGVVGCV